MKILTGKTGAPHVTSQQFRQLVEGTVGQDSYILNSGERLEPELVSNNSIKIRSGIMSHHGNLSVVDIGTYDEVNFNNGTQGMKRIDLVVNRYIQNAETGIEENEWIVIQGTPHESSPTVPGYTEGNLQDGDLVDDCPVLEIHLDGINVIEVKKLLPVATTCAELNSNLVQSGSGSVTLGSGAYKTITINFDKEFVEPPNVIACLEGSRFSNIFLVTVASVTTKILSIYVSNDYTQSSTIKYQWIAAGKVSVVS